MKLILLIVLIICIMTVAIEAKKDKDKKDKDNKGKDNQADKIVKKCAKEGKRVNKKVTKSIEKAAKKCEDHEDKDTQEACEADVICKAFAHYERLIADTKLAEGEVFFEFEGKCADVDLEDTDLEVDAAAAEKRSLLKKNKDKDDKTESEEEEDSGKSESIDDSAEDELSKAADNIEKQFKKSKVSQLLKKCEKKADDADACKESCLLAVAEASIDSAFKKFVAPAESARK